MTKAKNRRQKPSAPRFIGPKGVNDNAPLVANDNKPCVILLGDLPIVSRRPLDELSPGEMARVGRIEAAIRGRKGREASRLALEFEAALGITTEERITALHPANDLDKAIEVALGAAMMGYAETYTPPPPPKRAKRFKGKNKLKVKAPDPAAGFPPEQLRQDELDAIDKAEVQLRSGDMDLMKAGRDTIARIGRNVRTRVNDARMKAAREELTELEAMRGEVVEESDRPEHRCRIRVTTRDGLETAARPRNERKTGRMIPPILTEMQYAAGLRFRDDYEKLDPERGLTPPTLDQSRQITRGGDGWDLKRREIELRVRDLERMIQAEDPSFVGSHARHPVNQIGRALLMLREVAGKGTAITRLSPDGQTRFKNHEALRLALDCCAIAYGLE